MVAYRVHTAKKVKIHLLIYLMVLMLLAKVAQKLAET